VSVIRISISGANAAVLGVLCCAVLLASCGGNPRQGPETAVIYRDGSAFRSCRVLDIHIRIIPPKGTVVPSIVATSPVKMSVKMIEDVELNGPAACVATQYANPQGRKIFLFVSTNLSMAQKMVLLSEENKYLRELGLFSTIRSYDDG
jgi:hypothetical protein